MPASPAICLDSNAGGPPRLEVVAALLPLLHGEERLLFNPSSPHSLGRKAKRLLNRAKEQIASSFGNGATPDSVVFTSSGTEANQTVIRGVLENRLLKLEGDKPHWITSAAEHDSVHQMADWLQRRGGSVSFLPLRSDGTIDFSRLKSLIRPETALLSFLWVNNETGVINDVAAAAAIARDARIPLHLDSAQAWGKIGLELASSGADFATFSGHKIGALAGTGAIWRAPRAASLEPLLLGKQERGSRGGTENLLGAISLGAAAALLAPMAWSERTRVSRDQLESEILKAIPRARVNGAEGARVANTSSISLPGCKADGLIAALDLAGFAVSAGSACASGSLEPSRVLLAMGASEEIAKSTLRISLSDALESEVIREFVQALSNAVERSRAS